MRRTSKPKETAGSPVLIKGNMKIDCESRRVFIGEREINLTAKEFRRAGASRHEPKQGVQQGESSESYLGI